MVVWREVPSRSSGHHFSRSQLILRSAMVLYVLVSKVIAIGVPMLGSTFPPPARVPPSLARQSPSPCSIHLCRKRHHGSKIYRRISLSQ